MFSAKALNKVSVAHCVNKGKKLQTGNNKDYLGLILN